MLLGGLLEVGEDEGGDLLGCELLGLTPPLNLDPGVSISTIDDLKGECLTLGLDNLVVEGTSNETLNVVDGVVGVGGDLGLGGVTDGLTLGGEGNPGGHGAALGEGDNLYLLVNWVVGGNAGEGGTEIDTDDGLVVGVFCE